MKFSEAQLGDIILAQQEGGFDGYGVKNSKTTALMGGCFTVQLSPDLEVDVVDSILSPKKQDYTHYHKCLFCGKRYRCKTYHDFEDFIERLTGEIICSQPDYYYLTHAYHHGEPEFKEFQRNILLEEMKNWTKEERKEFFDGEDPLEADWWK